MASKVYEQIKDERFHNLDEVKKFLEGAGYEVRDITTQYCTVWEDGRLVALMFGGMTNNFGVAYEI